MNILPVISNFKDQMEVIYKDFHQHPEIGFEEVRTSQIVAQYLQDFGVDEVHTEIGVTGVVGVIRGKHAGNRRVGLRADMDALPIHEETDLPYKSQTDGKMHACGHDAHTTMLLGAAKHLAETRNFQGEVIVIFQPAEEGLGGAKAMIEDGLFDRFPCDEVYGMHNSPSGKPGTFEICRGAAMAGAAFFDIHVTGKGAHAAMPQNSKDAIQITNSLITDLNAIVSRNVPPLDTCVLSITQVHAGSAYNVIPQTAHLCGTIRYFKDDIFNLVCDRMQAICKGVGTAYDAEVTLDIRHAFTVLENDHDLSSAYLDAAADIVGADHVSDKIQPATGSEDFADMLKSIPGAYCRVGHVGTVGLHNPSFNLGLEVLPVGASIMARVAEKRLTPNAV